MEGYGLRFSRVAAALGGWLPLAAFAGSAWLFYAASDLDAVSRPLAPSAACAANPAEADAAGPRPAARPCGPAGLTAQR